MFVSDSLIALSERSIEAILEPYLTSSERTSKLSRLSETQIRQISSALRTIGKESWSKIPRIYAVLYMVKQVQVIDSFIREGISDLWFPFSHKTLPDGLRNTTDRFSFLDLQDLVLTKALDLEREDGKHRHFAKSDEVPLLKVEVLGKGSFGFVERVVSTITYKEYARKLIPRGKTFKKNIEVLRSFEQELSHLKKLSHQHIVEFIGSYTDPKFVGILMAPVADCNLQDFLYRNPLTPGDESFLRTFYGCLVSVLCYLHENKVRHKDIKPQNVLVKGHHVFLTDFGISVDWSDLGQSTTTGITVRTPRYCAPEVAEYLPRNSSADIWSLGCVFVEIWSVLKGESVPNLFKYMSEHGSKSTCYCLNQSSVKEWCSNLHLQVANPDEDPPLKWIEEALHPDYLKRCTAQMLYDYISEVNDDPEQRYAFSGICCIDLEDSSDSDRSSRRSSQMLDATGVSGIGVYQPSSDSPGLTGRLRLHDNSHRASLTIPPITPAVARSIQNVDDHDSKGERGPPATSEPNENNSMVTAITTKLVTEHDISTKYMFKDARGQKDNQSVTSLVAAVGNSMQNLEAFPVGAPSSPFSKHEEDIGALRSLESTKIEPKRSDDLAFAEFEAKVKGSQTIGDLHHMLDIRASTLDMSLADYITFLTQKNKGELVAETSWLNTTFDTTIPPAQLRRLKQRTVQSIDQLPLGQGVGGNTAEESKAKPSGVSDFKQNDLPNMRHFIVERIDDIDFAAAQSASNCDKERRLSPESPHTLNGNSNEKDLLHIVENIERRLKTANVTGPAVPRESMRQNPLPTSPGSTSSCAKCGNHFAEDWIAVPGKFYHPQCFPCAKCEPIVGMSHRVEAAATLMPLCKIHHSPRLGVTCAKCSAAIKGSYIAAGNRSYHEEHFACNACDLLLSRHEFYLGHDEKVYCHYHYSFLYADLCEGCQIPITKNYVDDFANKSKRYWHEDCILVFKSCNVKFAVRDVSSHSHSANLQAVANPTESERQQVRAKENTVLARAQHILHTITAYGETVALNLRILVQSQPDHGPGSDTPLPLWLFIFHLQVLFSSLEFVESLGPPKEVLGLRQEAASLCQKYDTLLTFVPQHDHEAGMIMAAQVPHTVTIINRYINILIHTGLQHALRVDHERGGFNHVSKFLNFFDSQLTNRRSEFTPTLVEFYRGNIPYRCDWCSVPVDSDCLQREMSTVWHQDCIKCKSCHMPGGIYPADASSTLPGLYVLECPQCGRLLLENFSHVTFWKRRTDLLLHAFTTKYSEYERISAHRADRGAQRPTNERHRHTDTVEETKQLHQSRQNVLGTDNMLSRRSIPQGSDWISDTIFQEDIRQSLPRRAEKLYQVTVPNEGESLTLERSTLDDGARDQHKRGTRGDQKPPVHTQHIKYYDVHTQQPKPSDSIQGTSNSIAGKGTEQRHPLLRDDGDQSKAASEFESEFEFESESEPDPYTNWGSDSDSELALELELRQLEKFSRRPQYAFKGSSKAPSPPVPREDLRNSDMNSSHHASVRTTAPATAAAAAAITTTTPQARKSRGLSRWARKFRSSQT